MITGLDLVEWQLEVIHNHPQSLLVLIQLPRLLLVTPYHSRKPKFPWLATPSRHVYMQRTHGMTSCLILVVFFISRHQHQRMSLPRP